MKWKKRQICIVIPWCDIWVKIIVFYFVNLLIILTTYILGYANEVGESFRNLVSKNVVRGSYVVATGYAVADTIDKTYKDFKQNSSVSSAGITAVDVFLWQMLASVSIPGFTINRYVKCIILNSRLVLLFGD